MISDRKVENISVERNKFRVGFLQLLCLEKLYAQEAKYEDLRVDAKDVKKLKKNESVKWFQVKN